MGSSGFHWGDTHRDPPPLVKLTLEIMHCCSLSDNFHAAFCIIASEAIHLLWGGEGGNTLSYLYGVPHIIALGKESSFDLVFCPAHSQLLRLVPQFYILSNFSFTCATKSAAWAVQYRAWERGYSIETPLGRYTET